MSHLPALLSVVCGLLMTGCAEPPAEPGHEKTGALGRYPLTESSMQQWRLPNVLDEISGLALTGDGRLFAIADEEAIVYQIDYVEGRLVKAFALGDPTVRGDFEGLAIIGDDFYLTTSDGDIYQTVESDDGERSDFERFETGIGDYCEIEGLAARGADLLLLCKKLRSTDMTEELAIFVWSSESKRYLPSNVITLPESEILDQLGSKRIRPSGLAVDPQTGNLLLVAAQQKALIELTPDGELVQATSLTQAQRHRQAEGIEFTPGGELLISDEGSGRRARMAVYSAATEKNKDRE